MNRFDSFPALVATAALFAAGCGTGAPVDVVKPSTVKGTVATASGPIKACVIKLVPEEGQTGPKTETVVVKADGTFTGSALPGKYKVVVDKEQSPGVSVPAKYYDAKTSDVSVEVSATGGDLTIAFK